VLSRGAASINVIVFGFIRNCREFLLEPAIYHMQGKHTTDYTNDVMDCTLVFKVSHSKLTVTHSNLTVTRSNLTITHINLEVIHST
jgi:hypothetical protein